MTALHWAAMNGDAPLATMLLGPAPTRRPATRVGGLHAADAGRQARPRRRGGGAARGGADPTATTDNGTTPLMFAAHPATCRRSSADRSPRGPQRPRDDARAHRRDVRRRCRIARGHRRCARPGTAPTCRRPRRRSTCRCSTGAASRACCSAIPSRRRRRVAKPARSSGGGRNGMNRPTAGPTRRPGVDRDFSGNELVNTHGGMTPLLFAARQGHIDTARALLDAGVTSTRRRSATGPVRCCSRPSTATSTWRRSCSTAAPIRIWPSINGVTPLYAVLNLEWARACRPAAAAGPQGPDGCPTSR